MFNYVRCACGSVIVIDAIMLELADKPMERIGSANICPNCKKIMSVNSIDKRYSQFQLERVYKIGQNFFTPRELSRPPQKLKTEQGPVSEYDPNKIIEGKGTDITF